MKNHNENNQANFDFKPGSMFVQYIFYISFLFTDNN
jgi:hypothetical protein